MIANLKHNETRDLRESFDHRGRGSFESHGSTVRIKIEFHCDSCHAELTVEGIGPDNTSARESLCEQMVNRFGWSSFDEGRKHQCVGCGSTSRTFEFVHPYLDEPKASVFVPPPPLDVDALDEVEELLKGDS